MEFSIVYITYRPGGIDILADSLKNQTVKDYELIVVDDYPINRRATVGGYLAGFGIPVAYVGPPKTKCFPELASGVMNAMNTGILLSTKEAVIILTDYIWLPPDWLERIAGHADLLRQNHCVVLGGQMWENEKPRDNQGIISVWEKQWEGSPEENGCQKSFFWMPESWEFSCTALPWTLIKIVNGFPEYLDARMAHPLEPIIKRMEAAGGKAYVDRENLTHMINHREWQPAELWHQAKRHQPEASVLPRENCFDLKIHTRGNAYWLEGIKADVFEKPEYWCGAIGYRPGPDGIGYRDFPIHQVKVDYILSRKPRGKVLDIGCAYGYIVKRLRDKKVDALGVDISQYALGQAPDEVKDYLKLASVDSLPFGDKEFDIAFSASTFEHLPAETLSKAISEAVRVAERGIIAVTPGDDPHFDEDVTHQTKQPLSWWRSQFPPQFEVRSDADERWLKKIPEVELHRMEWIRSKATLEAKILEVGCAENPVWAGTKFNVVTVDNQINQELQIFPDVVGEAEELPFEDNSFDIVSEGELLEHVPDPQRVLKQAIRVARKKVIITVPFEYEWPPDLKPFWNPGHVRFYTPESLEDELETLHFPFNIEIIRHGPWAWLGAEINKETIISQIKLNLGSFVDVVACNWENIDILSLRQYIPPEFKFLQWDLRRGIPHPDNSVDLIRMSHLIEHLTLEEAHKLLLEIYRVLKPSGFVRISTPDARLIVKHYVNRDMSYFNQMQPPEYILAPTDGERLSRLLFSGEYNHKAVYDFAMLKNFLHQAGFELGKVYLVGPQFSWSQTMQYETKDQHIEVSLIVEALK